jgi:hypothetical protein
MIETQRFRERERERQGRRGGGGGGESEREREREMQCMHETQAMFQECVKNTGGGRWSSCVSVRTSCFRVLVINKALRFIS